MISIVFLLKKTHLVLVYNAEITAAEITVIDLDLYGEHRPEERITGSKTDHNLSAGSTYTRVYTVHPDVGSFLFSDAPLLDQNHYNSETMRSHHSNTSDTILPSTNRSQCTDRVGYDTLRSQGSRSQSESSPIVELPEEQKDV